MTAETEVLLFIRKLKIYGSMHFATRQHQFLKSNKATNTDQNILFLETLCYLKIDTTLGTQ